MNLHSFQLYLALLTVVISTVTPLSCGPCNLDKCVKAVCKAGFVKDACGCCSVCAKTEGQKCGGLWNYYGICGAGLRCISSSDNSHQSSNHFKSGYCEPDLCANVQCKKGTSCVVVDGQPTCKCPRHCKNTKEPICEVKTGKEFINECFLRKYECKTGQSLTFYTGACRKCFHNGIMYKYGETIYKKRGCQFCSCRHGSWECDSKCKDQEIIPCKVSMIFNELVCPSGLICQKDVTMDGKPGICVPSKEPNPTEFFTDHTTKSPELPVKDVCSLPASPGPCANSLERWYYSAQASTCMKFYYGGCFGNSNNFNSKDECQRRCQQKDEDDKKEMCGMAPLHGPCQDKVKRWFFNKKTGKCQHFIYGGCGANANNFLTRKQCNHNCKYKQ